MLSLTILALTIFSYGCAGMAAGGGGAYIAGKAFLNKTRANVYVTDDNNYINKCVFVKYVSSNTSWGGAMLQDEALEKVISDITHKVNDAGANAILIKKLDKSFMGSTASGDAYRCNSIDSATTGQLN